MLRRNGRPFSSGSSFYYDEHPEETASGGGPKVFVTVGAGERLFYAQLDTGAHWTILQQELAEMLGLFDGTGPEQVLETVIGKFSGRLERYPLTLVAQHGENLVVDATIFACRDWNRHSFLGYVGFLERVKIALDPDQNEFHFGKCD